MRDGLDEICEFCTDYYQYVAPSLSHNAEAWSNQNFNYQYQSTLSARWLRQRAEYLLAQLTEAFMISGDVDCDGEVGISDVTALIGYLLTGDDKNIDLVAADTDGNSDIEIGDVTAIINLLLGID